MRPDRIIVGEVRGGETLDMLQAMNTGHEGSLVTVHANSCDDAIHRLETLATMSDLHIPFEALRDQINSAIHVIVQIDRFADGARRISEVAAVASERREEFRLGTVARFDADPIGPDRRSPGASSTSRCRTGSRATCAAGREGPGGVRRRRRAPPHAGARRRRDGQGRRRTPAAALRARAGDARASWLCVSRLARAARRSPSAAAGGRDEAAVARLRQRSTRGCGARRPAASSATGCRAPARRSRPADLVLLCFFGTLIAHGRAAALFMPPGLAFIFAFAAAVGVARVMVERKRGNRRDEFIDQLPDIARLLSNGTSAGLSMAGAIELAARELADPAATEMEIVVQETQARPAARGVAGARCATACPRARSRS